MSPRSQKPNRAAERLALVLLALLLHIAGGVQLAKHWHGFTLSAFEAPVSVALLDGDVIPGDVLPPGYEPEAVAAVEPLVEPEPEPKPEDPLDPEGQIVETARPLDPKVPLLSDYLAEHNNAVPEETRSRKYKLNPEILAPTYAEESKMEIADVADIGASDVSTGATAGGIQEDTLGKGAPRSLIPSQFSITNKEGLDAPTSASSTLQDVRGAPQNDLLDEKIGAGIALNTREFFGAEYINRIRRQVNFYWKQNLENLSTSVRLGKPRYLTSVSVVLNADGVLESIVVTDDSGQPAVDHCVVHAFQIAGPYPNPPAQLIKRDNRVYLPDFEFTVEVGQAQMQYHGVDPRANVQFPGIMNAPR